MELAGRILAHSWLDCGSCDMLRGQAALHSVSEWVCGLRLWVGLKSVEDKSNEIPAVQELGSRNRDAGTGTQHFGEVCDKHWIVEGFGRLTEPVS